MKKRCLFLAFACLIAVMSCEIPQSITIKGKPELRIPIGSPFKEGQGLGDNISSAKIKEMMGESGTGKVNTYDYTGNLVDSDVHAYIVHYPITEMKLDLAEYISDAFKNEDDTPLSFPLPAFLENLWPPNVSEYYLTGDKGPQDREGTPLFAVDLSDMTKLLLQVENGPFGIEIPHSQSFQNNLRVRIPALGINDYIAGVPTPANDKLRFVINGVFIPKNTMSNGKFDIYVKVTGPCSGTIAPEIIFDWTTAKIDTSNNSLKGEYPLNNTLGNFLGSDVEFKTVSGYIYVNGEGLLGNAATISLSIKHTGGNEEDLLGVSADHQLTEKQRPAFTEGQPFDGNLTDQSLHDPINLTHILSAASDSKLECVITIPDMTISKDDVTSKVIAADMVILLPLEFTVKTRPSNIQDAAQYVKLDLEFPQPGSGDLFGRTRNRDNDLFNQIDTVEIILKEFSNNIIEGSKLSILVTAAPNYRDSFNLNDPEPFITIDFDDLPNPFSPAFEILLEKEENKAGGGYEDHATLKIKRQDPDNPPEFDFNLVIEAKADINYEIAF